MFFFQFNPYLKKELSFECKNDNLRAKCWEGLNLSIKLTGLTWIKIVKLFDYSKALRCMFLEKEKLCSSKFVQILVTLVTLVTLLKESEGKMIKKSCCSRFALHEFVQPKYFWTLFKNVHLQCPCAYASWGHLSWGLTVHCFAELFSESGWNNNRSCMTFL